MEAVAIEREAKIVHALNLETGAKQQFAYDKLVLATGASPLKPAWPGVEKENIFHVWRPQDAAAIRRGLETQKYEKAVVIGAGLIGLEIAEALRMWDVDVTVVEMKNQLFPALLDEDMAQELELSLAAKGLQFLKEEAVEAFGGDAQVREVKTDKRTLTADLVILALGARPNVELARQAGLEIGTSGAIAVNEYLQTSDKAIFAGGDCAENTHRVSGEKVFLPMGSTANKHGRVIGENLCGAGVKFGGVLGTAAVKLFEMQVGRTGLNERQGAAAGFECVSVTVAGYDRPHYMKAARKVLLKLTADAVSRQLLGMQAWGEGDVVKRVDVAAMALSLGATVDKLFDADLAYSPPFNSPIDMLAVAANKLTAKLGRC